MTNELMTTLITAELIIIQSTVTMLIKKAPTAAASAGVTTHLWKAVASRTDGQAGERDSSEGRHAARSFGGEFKNATARTHYI